MATTKQIVDKLIEVVPPPRHKPPHPQDSWATLKMGDVLVRSGDSGELGNQAIGLWEAVNVTSAGVTLKNGEGEWVELSDRKWKESGWRKLGKREIVKLREMDNDY